MTFQLFDKVRIKDKNVIGMIVDIYDGDDGQPVYTVERQKRRYVNDPAAYSGDFPLYDCREERLTRL